MKTGKVYRLRKEVMEKMHLRHIEGIVFCGLLFDTYYDRETGKKYLKVEGETGGDIVLVEMKEEGGKLDGTPNDGKTQDR